jgi:hypothetical protein
MMQIGWGATAPALFHFRTHAGEEVDLVLEQRSGSVVGIEIKNGATVSSADLSGLRTLREAAGGRFRRGIVLYTGQDVVPFGDRLWAVPVDALWRWGGRAVGRSAPQSVPRPVREA